MYGSRLMEFYVVMWIFNRIPRRRKIEIYVFFFSGSQKKVMNRVEVKDIPEGQRSLAVLRVNILCIPGSENNFRKHWKVEDISERNQT
jgi:hypothetical protein